MKKLILILIIQTAGTIVCAQKILDDGRYFCSREFDFSGANPVPIQRPTIIDLSDSLILIRYLSEGSTQESVHFKVKRKSCSSRKCVYYTVNGLAFILTRNELILQSYDIRTYVLDYKTIRNFTGLKKMDDSK